MHFVEQLHLEKSVDTDLSICLFALAGLLNPAKKANAAWI
jgi:hypothetical protein